jgi:hypothetical protein
MRRLLRDNGLTLALAAMFAASLAGMLLAGHRHQNEELARTGAATIGLLAYAGSADFLSALFENWESEFLQMSVYVVLTAMLFQRGSAESRDPDKADAPPSGGGSWLYRHSLGLVLFLLFLLSFGLHWWHSMQAAREEAARLGGAAPGFWAYGLDAGLWFESFQNWQSEFLSTGVLVVLSIFLRQAGSPESKPVEAPHLQTGD